MKKNFVLTVLSIILILTVAPRLSIGGSSINHFGANNPKVALTLDDCENHTKSNCPFEKVTQRGETRWKFHMSIDINRPMGRSAVSINTLQLKATPVGSTEWKETVSKNIAIDQAINDYEVAITVPQDWRCIKVKAIATTSAGDGRGNSSSDTWTGSVASGTGNHHSKIPGKMTLSTDAKKPKSDGFYSSDTQSIAVRACKSDMFLEVNGDDAELKHEKEASEKINSQWAFWADPQYSPNSITELPDSSPDSVNSDTWVNAKNLSKTIKIPRGWSGKIKYRMIVERNGLTDLAGEYSGTVDLEIRE